jgi:8-oxo-dGTP diphosphatase
MLWEFPGGKIEPEETESKALARECREELGIEVAVSELEARNIHTYADLDIELLLYRCSIVEGEPQALHANAVRYVDIEQLRQLPFCDADVPFVEQLVARRAPDRS